MIKEFEKQMLLTEKTNELLREIEEYTLEIKGNNESNLDKIKAQIEADVQEIVDYCIKMGIPKNKTGWSKPSERVVLRESKDNTICFEIIYDTVTAKHEWYVGYNKYGVGYEICDGLFCSSHSFSNYQPMWSKGESEIVQYLCSNWSELKTLIINGICEKIAKENERKLVNATKELSKQVGNLTASNEELGKQEEGHCEGCKDCGKKTDAPCLVI